MGKDMPDIMMLLKKKFPMHYAWIEVQLNKE